MGITSVDWSDTEYYQFCNRLAVLHLVMSRNIPARLVHVYFMGSNFTRGKQCCGTQQEWRDVTDEMYSAIGLGSECRYHDRVHEVFLHA